ncbi:MAG: hypothetical protein ACT4OO_15790 [Nitrospiraceae bacterium]
MHDRFRSLETLVNIFGACLLVSVLGALMPTDVLRASTLPPVEPMISF